jgi:hypothetical protein
MTTYTNPPERTKARARDGEMDGEIMMNKFFVNPDSLLIVSFILEVSFG